MMRATAKRAIPMTPPHPSVTSADTIPAAAMRPKITYAARILGLPHSQSRATAAVATPSDTKPNVKPTGPAVAVAASAPAVADVIGPHQRSTALGVVFAIGLLIGGAGGPIAVGAVSDSLATSATGLSADVAVAQGLQGAMMIMVPIAFAVAALGMFISTRTMNKDHAAMLAREAA